MGPVLLPLPHSFRTREHGEGREGWRRQGATKVNPQKGYLAAIKVTANVNLVSSSDTL